MPEDDTAEQGYPEIIDAPTQTGNTSAEAGQTRVGIGVGISI